MTVKAQMKMSNNKAAILLTKIPLPASKPVASESADVTLTVIHVMLTDKRCNGL
ncbi:uncharacterized protein PHALS_01660 [Plasmopara halstedii]|uniref:Uncharacterized protein n=1 Tax=Plasmopara halstedii TaxID=4781 RepID=A0A0P1AWF1_PLAHL|nr:uncharacterized protein PHALS_01660 [Plasmopara halstedii]CEG45356.1 hypothetical protein PHALS_01660 [Plasmopara halstedii]|eukprot:XP_024581725.1 hypothetical protein PHALS_01660 [Plasmopara halstedii]